MSDQPINADVAGAAAGTGEPQVNDTAQPTGESNGNPAWGELLGAVPTSLHPTIRPHLEKWEKTAQDRITRVQSEYAPYKDFLGTPPDQIQASLQLAQLIATDPRSFYDRMTDYYGEEWGLGQGLDTDDAGDDFGIEDEGEEGEQSLDLSNNPLLQQIQEQQNTIAQVLAMQLQERQQNEERAATEAASNQIMTEMDTAAKQYGFEDGKFPVELERMILSVALQNEGITLTDAAKQVMAVAQPKQPMPRIISPGGGVPAGGIDTRNMNSKDTKSLVATILAQQKAAESQ